MNNIIFHRHEETIDLLNKITAWAEARNLIKGATPAAQFVKLTEENGEIAEGLAEQNDDKIQDGIGDVAVVITVLAAQHGLTVQECMTYLDELLDDPEYKVFPLDDLELAYSYYAGVLASGIAKKNLPRIKQGIAHIFVIQEERSCRLLGKPVVECIASSYNEIKDRKGKMVDGVFIKEADFHLFGITE